jgi:hypothetical protein
MADIEDQPQSKMAFMFCPRRDCIVDTVVEQKVREKFTDVKTYRCANLAAGWPSGPNAMVHEIYSMFVKKCHSTGNDRWNYAAIFFGEPDCIPLCKDWVDRIYREWHECDWSWPLGNRQLVLGHWLTRYDNAHGLVHINGNLLLSPEFLAAYPAFTQTRLGAWDTTHCRALLAHARPSKTIYSDYGVGKDPSKPWLGCEDLFKQRTLTGPFPMERVFTHPAYLHGVKDLRSIGCVRSKLGVVPAHNDRLPQK